MSSYRIAKLSEVAEVGAGNSAPQKKELFHEGIHPFVRTSDVGKIRFGMISTAADLLNDKGIKGLRLVPKGTILMPKSGASTFLNHRVETSIDCYVSSHLATVTAKPDKAIPRYLLYFLSTVQAQDLIQDHRYPSLTLGVIGSIEVSLPPLEEQKRIVAVLDQAFAALDRARALAEANLADAEGFFASFIEAELEKSGGAVLTLQQMLDAGIVLSHLDGNHGENYPRKEEFVPAGVPYVSANCIKDGQIDLTLAKFLSEDRAAVFKKGVAQDGDVIFAHNATVGPVAILRTEEPNVILSTSVTYYRPSLESILPEFLMYEMRSSAFKKQYEAVMKQATRNQVPITAQRRLTHTIPDLPVQRQVIAAAIELEGKSRSLVDLYSRQISDINEVRASLLQKAFAGELT